MKAFLRLGTLRFDVIRFFCALLAALSVQTAASAQDQNNSTGEPDNTQRWTVSLEAVVLERTSGAKQTLVERVPGTVPFYAPAPLYDTANAPGTEALNSAGLHHGFSVGPKVRLTYHDDSGYGVQLVYFNTFDQRATRTIGPDDPADWLVMKAPGAFWQTQDFPYQAMAWSSATSLYSAELNGRRDIPGGVTLLAGFRWLQLNDGLEGSVTPADRTLPTWKLTCPGCDLYHVTESATPGGNYPPFWTTRTTNNFYGVQIGAAGTILQLGRFSFGGELKLGLFDNNAEQTTGVSMRKQIFPSHSATDHAAIAGDAGLHLEYQILEALALRAGYQALWFGGVTLAPGQIQETSTSQTAVRALGVNRGSNVLFHGATLGLKYSF